ncbi:MAG: zinc metallopeptidase [Clostridia bacterium]|nr:zinc metallopeptidase [Clostridia bacterium]
MVMYYYFWLMIPALLLSLYAQAKVGSTFRKYSKVRTESGITGAMTARRMLDEGGLNDVDVVRISGNLTDNFDPKKGIISLSDSVHSSSSVSAVGVAAHETGHALQHRDEYGPMKLRSFLVPVANIGSVAGPYIAIAGLIFSIDILLELGIVLFSAAVLFYLVTLPVEMNASRRAMELLETGGILNNNELSSAKKVLNAAALTYIAAALSAIMTLVRLILISRNRR